MDQQNFNDEFIKKMFPGIDSVPTISSLYSQVTPASVLPMKMQFETLLDYKTTPCDRPDCPYYPRTTVANNQYLEDELRCHGFHHIKDQRRKAIRNIETFTGEFEYQANYYREGKCPLSKEKYSQNFFESLYHPLYYKQFICKRDHCDKTMYCPYFHNEREKLEWELIFEQKLKVNRKIFLSTKTRQVHIPDSPKNFIGGSSDKGDMTSSSDSRSHYSQPESYGRGRGGPAVENKPFVRNNQDILGLMLNGPFINESYNQFGYNTGIGSRTMAPLHFESRARLV